MSNNQTQLATMARRAAHAAVVSIRKEHKAAGGNLRDFHVRIRCERAVRDIMGAWIPDGFRPCLRVSEDRKTSSIGTFFALSSCQPTHNCLNWCYILNNCATGPNGAWSIVKSVENTLACELDPEGWANYLIDLAATQASKLQRQVSIRISNGGEVPKAFLEALMRIIPTRMLFSVDSSSVKLPMGLDPSDYAYTVEHGRSALRDVTVNFPMHGKGPHWTADHLKAVGDGFLCPAVGDKLENSPCGVSCFRCFPDTSRDYQDEPVVAWGFTKRPDVWQTYEKGRKLLITA